MTLQRARLTLPDIFDDVRTASLLIAQHATALAGLGTVDTYQVETRRETAPFWVAEIISIAETAQDFNPIPVSNLRVVLQYHHTALAAANEDNGIERERLLAYAYQEFKRRNQLQVGEIGGDYFDGVRGLAPQGISGLTVRKGVSQQKETLGIAVEFTAPIQLEFDYL